MVRYKHNVSLIVFLSICIVEYTTADTFSDIMRSQDPCKDICSGVQFSAHSNKHVRQTCQRGCRFFNIARRSGASTKRARKNCHLSCSDSFPSRAHDQLSACRMGCDLTSKQFEQLSDVWMIYIGQEVEADESILKVHPEPDLENDLLLTDPIFRNQLEWNYGVEYKIPETHIRTMPVSNSNNDFGIPGLSSSENQPNGKNNRDQHATSTNECLEFANKIKLPRWLVILAGLLVALLALHICFAPQQISPPILVPVDEFTAPPKYNLINEKV